MPLEAAHRLLLDVREDVGVDVHRHVAAGVAEDLLHHLDRLLGDPALEILADRDPAGIELVAFLPLAPEFPELADHLALGASGDASGPLFRRDWLRWLSPLAAAVGASADRPLALGSPVLLPSRHDAHGSARAEFFRPSGGARFVGSDTDEKYSARSQDLLSYVYAH